MTVDLTIACTDYDWTRPVWDGDIEHEGIDLHHVDYHNPERFARMVNHGEFDACELSLGSYLASRASEQSFPFTAIPVFPYRKFRHSFIYRRAADDITLSELDGANVGIIHWQTTTAVWQRGIAAEHYGVDLKSITWHAVKSESDIVPVEIPERYDIVANHRDGGTTEAFVSMLRDGEIDVAFSTSPLSARVVDGRHDDVTAEASAATNDIERIFDDSAAVEADYYRETGIFPPMHTIVIRDDVLDAYPWVANKLYESFERALEQCLDRLTKPRWFPLAWANQHVEHQRSVLGTNPWEYGIEANRDALATLQRYAAEQGLVDEPEEVESLFVESTVR
jgi:4,5-dihydroxyphthalate decarboxylase